MSNTDPTCAKFQADLQALASTQEALNMLMPALAELAPIKKEYDEVRGRYKATLKKVLMIRSQLNDFISEELNRVINVEKD